MRLGRNFGNWLVLLVATATIGCNLLPVKGAPEEQAHGYSERSFSDVWLLGAVPMKVVGTNGGESFEPVCDGASTEVDGLLLRALFAGTSIKEEGFEDRDLSLRDGDRVGQQTLDENQINTGNFDLHLDCVEQVLLQEHKCRTSDDCEDPEGCGNRIKGYCLEDGPTNYCYSQIKSEGLAISQIAFKPLTPSRGTGIGVAILVDMSGSNAGLVNYHPPYNEDTMGDATLSIPEGATYAQNGSDPGGTRLAAVKNVIETLNDNDKVVVFSFNENKIDIVCDHPDKTNPSFDEKRDACFSSDKTLVLGDPGSYSALDEIRNYSQGRTPLWTAVDLAYDYLQNHDAARGTRYKHILVISDGPDTCSDSPELNRCREACLSYQTTYEQALSRIQADAFADRIPVHFVQFAAKGYPDRDARQLRVACETGGNYLFLNALDLPPTELANHLKDAVRRVRYTFGGYWELAVKLDTIKNNTDMPRGWDYALEGKMNVSEPQLIYDDSTRVFAFSINSSTYLDGRLAFHKDCTSDGDCPADDSSGTCATRTWSCDHSSGACKAFDAWNANGSGEEGCKPVKAVLKLQRRNSNGSIVGQNITEVLGYQVPTLCCAGACVPPRPPQMPSEYADSTVSGKCYEPQGWKPDDKDSSTWNFWAVYYVNKEGCIQNAEDAANQLEYGDVGSLSFPADWDCEATENCFHP